MLKKKQTKTKYLGQPLKKINKLHKLKTNQPADFDLSDSEHESWGDQKNSSELFNSTFSLTSNKTNPPFIVDDSFQETSSVKSTFSTCKKPFVNHIDLNNYVFGENTLLNRCRSPATFSCLSSTARNNYESKSDTASVFNCSYSNKLTFDTDLHRSFLNLNLGVANRNKYLTKTKSNPVINVNTNATRPRPLLSPAKLNLLESFYKNRNDYVLNERNLSRSSSQSSGFGSQTPDEYNQEKPKYTLYENFEKPKTYEMCPNSNNRSFAPYIGGGQHENFHWCPYKNVSDKFNSGRTVIAPKAFSESGCFVGKRKNGLFKHEFVLPD